MDLITGADGGVLIADWCDTGECHDHDGVHRTSGRIYKLTYGKPKPVASFDLAKSSDEELIKLQSHPNDWYARQSRRLLQERQAAFENARAAGTADADGEVAARQRQTLLRAALNSNTQDGKLWLKDFWAANVTGNLDLLALGSLLFLRARADIESEDENAAIRVWCLRLLAERLPQFDAKETAAVAATWARLVHVERDGLVELYLASALQQLPLDLRWPIAEGLAAERELAGDRMFPRNRCGTASVSAVAGAIPSRDCAFAGRPFADSAAQREHRTAADTGN